MPEITHSFIWRKDANGKWSSEEVPVTPEPEPTDKQKCETIEFWNSLIDFPNACIGCGYCCAKAPCEIAQRHDCWDLETGCKALVWDGSRHLCQFYLDNPEVIGDILGIGWGCSSALFNSYREKIRNLVGVRLP